MTRIDGPWRADLYRHSQISSRIGELSSRLTSGQRISGPGDEPTDWREWSVTRDRLTTLTSVNTAMGSLAISLREVSHTVDTVAKYLGDLQSEYEVIVAYGNPPATTHLIEERALHVEKFNTILQQIDNLTTYNAEDIPRTLLADPTKASGTGDFQVVINEAGDTRTIRAQQLHVGPGGLDLFPISVPPAQAELDAIAQRLEVARNTLQTRQQAFDWDTSALAREIQRNKGIEAELLLYADNLQAVDNEQTAAALQALEVGQALTVNSHRLVYDLKSSLLEIIG